jgi:hypothetical protein
LDLNAFFNLDLFTDFGHYRQHMLLEDADGPKESCDLTTEDGADVHTLDLIGTLDAHLSFLFGHDLQVVEGRLLNQDLLISQ